MSELSSLGLLRAIGLTGINFKILKICTLAIIASNITHYLQLLTSLLFIVKAGFLVSSPRVSLILLNFKQHWINKLTMRYTE